MKKIVLVFFLGLTSFLLHAQSVGIGTTTPHANAILDLNSSNKGLLLPRVADTNLIVGAKPAGLTIYSNSDNRLYFYDGTKWQSSFAATNSDSLWFLRDDSTVYSNRMRVGFGLQAGTVPNANFHGTGSFLMQQPVQISKSAPTSGQTVIMDNTSTVTMLSTEDSVFRILDPGGASAPYTNLNQGSVRIMNAAIAYLAYQISFSNSGFGLGPGDTLWISTALPDNFRNDFQHRFTNTTAVPPTLYMANDYLNALFIYFRADGGGNNGDGFDITVRRIYNDTVASNRVVPFGKVMSFSPDDVSFRAGLVKGDHVGFGSFAGGYQVSAQGDYSVALGNNNYADSLSSLALGSNIISRGNYGIGIGNSNTVGLESIAIGKNIAANSTKQFGLGYSVNATGVQAVALGNSITAGGDFSFTAGHSATSSGLHPVAIGKSVTASAYSVAIGNDATANNGSAVAIGSFVSATSNSVAIGNGSVGSMPAAVAIGYNSLATKQGSTAIGNEASASGSNSIAIGSIASATGTGSVAIGRSVFASGDYSTAMGYLTFANFNYATAMGTFTNANGLASTALGDHTKTNSAYSLVTGRYNDTLEAPGVSFGSASPLFMVGNGTNENVRSNAFVVRNSGNTQISGFTSLGRTSEQAPAIKMKEITGQSSSNIDGGFVIFPHGLSRSKIIAMNIALNYGAGDVLPSHKASNGFEYNVSFDDLNIYVFNISGNCNNILNKPLKVLITYKE